MVRSLLSFLNQNLAPARDCFEDVRREQAGGRIVRTCGFAVVALVGTIWVPPLLCGLWFVLVFSYLLVVGPFVEGRIVTPRLRKPGRVEWLIVGHYFIGASIVALGGGAILISGGPASALVGAVWLYSSIALLRVTRSGLMFFSAALANLMVLVVSVCLVDASNIEKAVMLSVAVLTVAGLIASGNKQRTLTVQAELDRGAREEAERESLAKSRFIATISHELRTPLNAIIGYSEILEEDLAGQETQRDVGRIYNSAKHLLDLINNVLAFTQDEAAALLNKEAPVEIEHLVVEVANSVRALATQGRNVVATACPKEIGAALVHEESLRRCLILLAVNACRYTQDGMVTVAASVRFSTEGDKLELSVSDTGIGIKQEDLQRIFEPFVQIDDGLTRKHDGLGLGLAVAQRLAHQMAGNIEVASTFGEGATFTLTVPLAQVRSESNAAAA